MCPTRGRLIKRDAIHGGSQFTQLPLFGAPRARRVYQGDVCRCNLIRRQYRAAELFQPSRASVPRRELYPIPRKILDCNLNDARAYN